jgi:hypothetical protein
MPINHRAIKVRIISQVYSLWQDIYQQGINEYSAAQKSSELLKINRSTPHGKAEIENKESEVDLNITGQHMSIRLYSFKKVTKNDNC